VAIELTGFQAAILKFQEAIQRAKKLLQAEAGQTPVRFMVGPTLVSFLEEESVTTNAIQSVLMAPPGESRPSGVRIVGDYSGWHLDNGFSHDILEEMNLGHLQRLAAEFGLKFSYYGPTHRWDIYDVEKKIGIRFLPNPDANPEWEMSSPLGNFCAWIAEQDGLVMLHGGTLSRNGESGVLLVGEGGSGKSGATLECVLNGFSTVGDDYVLVSTRPPFFVYPIIQSLKQDERGLQRLGITPSGDPNFQGKYILTLSSLLEPERIKPFKLTSIVVPKIVDTDTTLKECSSQEAFKALAIPVARQLPYDLKALFSITALLVRELPCYSLQVKRSDPNVVQVISDLCKSGEVPECWAY